MKSRCDILEELDIKCCSSVVVAVSDDHGIKTLSEMAQVKASLLIVASVFITRTCGLDGQLKKYIFNNNGLGTYSFEYETQEGTFRREDGGLVNDPAVGRSLTVRGEYGYKDSNGRPFVLKYVADANGFQPQLEEDTRFNDRRIY